jgi:hypothetical protein
MAKPNMNKNDPSVNANANFLGLTATTAQVRARSAPYLDVELTEGEEEEGYAETGHSTRATC